MVAQRTLGKVRIAAGHGDPVRYSNHRYGLVATLEILTLGHMVKHNRHLFTPSCSLRSFE